MNSQSAGIPVLQGREDVNHRLLLIALATSLAGCSPSSQRGEVDALKRRVAQLESELAAAKAPPVASAASQTIKGQPKQALPEPAASEPAAPAVPSAWYYSAQEDKMTGKQTYSAAVISSNTVNFGFPYSGEQNARLVLRSDPKYGKDVVFSIEKGQLLCRSYEDCTVMARFDEGKPETFSAVGAADNSTETVFLRNYDRFIGKLRTAKMVRISMNIYQQGAPVFEFNVAGFDQERYIPKK